MKLIRRSVLICVGLFLLAAPVHAGETLLMATTTSTDNTGLLDYLSPQFTEDTGIELKWTATGTGKALKLGENCDVDVLLVHAPGAEKKYVEDGFGIHRREIMYNDFVIIGPSLDPAGIKGKGVLDALTLVRNSGSPFASRGDNSGTHKMELTLWNNTGKALPDKESWYVQTGQGMLPTITIAGERKAYTLTDRGTYIKYEATQGGKPTLVILVEGDGALKNQYSVIEVNPIKCPKAKNNLAAVFSNWMASEKTQKRIGDFKLLGKQLFTPNAQTK
ncbi:MAG: substrate-binding domain-containing protein [Proteobacteria bacterium]|nr:substrate-binding domain-containing protein [Pseudomonadota bacterium]